MRCTPDDIIGPPGQHVSGIDNDGIGDRRRVDEGPIGALDLQAAQRVLEKQGDSAVIAMFAGAHLAGLRAEHILGHGGIVQQTNKIIRAVCEPVEGVLGQAHADGDGVHQLRVQGGAAGGEVEHDVLEALALLVLRRPEIPDASGALGADLHGLFQVGVDLALRVDLGGVVRVAQFLAAVGDVAAIGLGTGPGQALLLLLRALEEQFGTGERFGNCGRGNPVVFQINKTGGLECVGDAVGNRLLIRRCTIEEGTKVDELENGSEREKRRVFLGLTGIVFIAWASVEQVLLGIVASTDGIPQSGHILYTFLCRFGAGIAKIAAPRVWKAN